MTINHHAQKGVNFIMVDYYRILDNISLYGFFEKENVFKNSDTIGIWNIKYKTQNL